MGWKAKREARLLPFICSHLISTAQSTHHAGIGAQPLSGPTPPCPQQRAPYSKRACVWRFANNSSLLEPPLLCALSSESGELLKTWKFLLHLAPVEPKLWSTWVMHYVLDSPVESKTPTMDGSVDDILVTDDDESLLFNVTVVSGLSYSASQSSTAVGARFCGNHHPLLFPRLKSPKFLSIHVHGSIGRQTSPQTLPFPNVSSPA
jgi:hypothetical protein